MNSPATGTDTNQIRQCHSCSYLLDKHGQPTFNVLPRARGLSLEGFNTLFRTCLCKPQEFKGEFRQRSYSMFDRIQRSTKKRKAVRFADALGLDYAVTVREYDDSLLPIVPERLLSKPEDNNSYIEEETVKLTFKSNFNPRDHSQIEDLIRRQNVTLYKFDISDNILSGLVLVADIGKDKTLIVRWTHNKWVNQEDSYSPFCSKYSPSIHQFSFQIIIPPSVMLLGGSLELAICFRCDGRDFWDSNNGDNYRFIRTLCPFSN